MDWITDQIAIGNHLEALDSALLRQESIAAVLGLTRTLHGLEPKRLGLKEIEIFPLDDGHGNDPRLFRQAVDTLLRLVRDAPPVFVHCHAGRSRSAVVVAGYFMKTRQLGPDEALACVAAKRTIAVSAGLEKLLNFLE